MMSKADPRLPGGISEATRELAAPAEAGEWRGAWLRLRRFLGRANTDMGIDRDIGLNLNI